MSRDTDARWDFALIDCSASTPLARKGSQLFGQGMFARLSVSAVSYLPVDADVSADLATPLALRREYAERRCADRLTRGGTAPAPVQASGETPTDAQIDRGVPVSAASGAAVAAPRLQ